MRTEGPNCAEAGRRADLVCQARRNNVNNAYPQDAPWYVPRMSGRPGRTWPVSGRGLCVGAAGIFLHVHFRPVLVLGRNAEDIYILIANPIAAVDGKIAIFAIIIIAPGIECPA